MKILFIGDPHLKINKLELNVRFLTWLNDLIKDKKPDLVVNLGDTFDTHAVLRSEILNEFIGHVDYVNSLTIPYVYVVGNHDMFKPNDAKYHALRPFKNKSDLFYIIDEPTDLFDISFVPYQHDLSKFPNNTKAICVAHQTFLGADYGSIVAPTGVDTATIDGCEIIISGHVHKKQLLKSNSGPDVLYVGSPFSQGASDVDQVKGITIFDTATYDQTFIQCPLPSWKKMSFIISPSNSIETIHNSIINNIIGSKDNWVLEIEGPKPEVISYLSSNIYLEATKDISIKVKTIFTEKEKRKISIEARSLDSIISDYVSKVYNGTIDKQKLLEAAKTVLKTSHQDTSP